LHFGPHFYGAGRLHPPELGIADHSSQKPVVAGGDSVVIVKVKLGKGGNVNLEFCVAVYTVGESVVKTVYALDNKHVLAV